MSQTVWNELSVKRSGRGRRKDEMLRDFLRDQMAADFAGTVRKVAEMGYAGVEFAGTGDLSAAAMGELLAETGLSPAGAHVGLGEFESALDEVIAYHSAIGNRWVGVPWLPDELRNPAGFRQVAQAMNRLMAPLTASSRIGLIDQ